MRYFITVLLIFLSIFIASSCKKRQPPSKINQDIPVQEKANDNSAKEEHSPETPTQSAAASDDEGRSNYELFADKDTKIISYKGYTIIKTSKKIWEKVEGKYITETIPYSILKKGKKIIKKFEYENFSLIEPGIKLLNLLGDKEKQLFVGQVEPRAARFWVIRLSPEYRVLFDSDEYGGSRDEMWIDDIDKDGVYELKVRTYGCTSIGRTFNLHSTPQPIILFKYNRKANKYLPANFLFQDYERKEIEQTISRLQPTSEKPDLTDNQSLDEGFYFREMTEVFLQYVYARREREAWAFLDKFYNLPDKNEVKSSIRAALRRDKIYRLIYSKYARKR